AARKAQEGRHQRPQLFIDISVPRNIEPSVGTLENIYLYNLDDLDSLAAEHRVRRERAAHEAEVLLRTALEGIKDWLASAGIGPALGRLSAHFETIRATEVARVAGRLSKLSPEDHEKVDALTKAIVSKLLHAPISRIKAQAARGEGNLALLRGAEDLFGLGSEDGK
ncbi:MAG: hypothetical protein ACREKE_05255, partial [bacterium]